MYRIDSVKHLKDVKHRFSETAKRFKDLKGLKDHNHNIHKSLRNGGLSTLYRKWLQRETPFFAKILRPTQGRIPIPRGPRQFGGAGPLNPLASH